MEMNFDALRQGQRHAVNLIGRRVQAGGKRTALIIPTRYGKSDIARVTTIGLVDDGLVGCALALSPNELLRDQLGSLEKWNETIQRYQMRLKSQPMITRLVQAIVRPNANGEIFLSSTMQLVATNLQLFADWVDSEVNRTGLPPIVWDDECHMSSEDNTWGGVVDTLVDAGAHLVMMTATGDRADGGRIPGFEFDLLDEEEVDVWRTGPGSEPDKIVVQMLHGIRSRLRLRADLEVTFREAWHDGCLCKVSHIPFDVRLASPADGTPVGLGELSQDQTRKVLGSIVRQADVIGDGCARFV